MKPNQNPKQKNNYINEDELFELIIQWKEDRKNKIPMSNRLGVLFMEMCKGVISKPNYKNLDPTIKEDLISASLYNLVKYIHNFKPERAKSSHSAFTYTTWAIETCYKGCLSKEKMKQERMEILFNSDIIESIYEN